MDSLETSNKHDFGGYHAMENTRPSKLLGHLSSWLLGIFEVYKILFHTALHTEQRCNIGKNSSTMDSLETSNKHDFGGDHAMENTRPSKLLGHLSSWILGIFEVCKILFHTALHK